MDVILNLWREQLHEIVISTKAGCKLRLHIDQTPAGFCLVGEFYEVADRAWYLVEFTNQRVQDAEALLKGCLENLHRAMEKKTDSITELLNTCNTPIVSAEKQNELLAGLGINAQVKVS